MDCEEFKYSYLYTHIIIYNSPFLTVERVVSQRTEASTTRVLVQLIMIPRQPLLKVTYHLDYQECIGT